MLLLWLVLPMLADGQLMNLRGAVPLISKPISDATTQLMNLRGAMEAAIDGRLKEAAPKGLYQGTRTVLGMEVTGIMVLEAETLDFAVTGPVGIECDDESYEYKNGAITFDHIDEKGDCLHDDLHSNKADLDSVTYDPKSDTITVVVKYEKIHVSIDLDHQSSE